MPLIEEFDGLTLIRLAIKFKEDRDALVDWLRINGMLASTMICEQCQNLMNLQCCSRSIDGKTWRCVNRACRRKTNIRKGSFFERSHLELWKVLCLTYLWSSTCGSSRGPSYEFIQKELEIGGTHTIWDWFQFCRDICYDHFVSIPQMIGGPGA